MSKFTQKFKRGQKVRIGDMPIYMKHFPNNIDAIVVGTYNEIIFHSSHLGGNESKEYKLLILFKDKEPFTCSWYEENQLTLIDSNIEENKKLLEKYWNQ
jgi:hypothetical protein